MSYSSTKNCFNSNCNNALEQSSKGWRLRTGEYAKLCDRCTSAYEEGKLCETFHLNASGWRCCESCGKQIHCGCIVSFHVFILLDAGGIECITCARKSFILTPNPAWPPHSLSHPLQPGRTIVPPVKSWSRSPVSWCKTPSLFITSQGQSELLPRTPFEVDLPSNIGRLNASKQLSAPALELNKAEDLSARLINGILKLGTKGEELLNPCLNVSQQPYFSKNDLHTPPFALAVPSELPNELNGQSKVSEIHAQRLTPRPPARKQFRVRNRVASYGEVHIHNGRPRGDAQGGNRLLPQYSPRISYQELQQISGVSNLSITPLFEKMLTASDADRVGRLVVPRKYAEAYFPPISQPEGITLKVQDLKGKDWAFHFWFWPKSNSRIYALKGFSHYRRSMQVQAGDIVTFSRLEPEGKLVIGFRKASHTPLSDQVNDTVNVSDGFAITPDFSSMNPSIMADPADICSKVDIANEVVGAKSSFLTKRKNKRMDLKSKRSRIENEELVELKITQGQAQGLLRSPPKHASSVVDAPIIGRPTIFPTENSRENIQRAQCEDCFKWRKIPADALLPSRWTCSENLWDPQSWLCGFDCAAASEKIKAVPDSDEALEGRPPSEEIQSEKESNGAHQNHRIQLLSDQFPIDIPFYNDRQNSSPDQKVIMATDEPEQDDPSRRRSSVSPFKGQIDLNIQPKWEEKLSLELHSSNMMRLLREATEKYLRQHRFSDSSANTNSGAEAELAVTMSMNYASASDR